MTALACLLALSSLAACVSASSYLATCAQIASAISSQSEVFYPVSLSISLDPLSIKDPYADANSHWMSSSSQVSACAVEPGTPADVGVILQILGSTQTPFAVKGGGHATNPQFSSTTGVQISMSRFSQVTYDPTAGTATIGSGLIWDDVYDALAPHDVNVVGGRVSGVGVAGLTLGGGYSWKTSQYGLTIDTVQGFEVALPNGTVTSATATLNPDLFFGLKGGFNNFGIVTNFVLKTFPQTQVWGGFITYTGDNLDAVNAATANFAANNTDPKAAIITTYNFLLGSIGASELIFYDAPTPPDGLFDDFLAIPSFTSDISTRSYVSLVQSTPSNATTNLRGAFHTVSLTGYPPAMLAAIVNETTTYGIKHQVDTGLLISYDVEPFLPTLFSHNSTPSAYPPSRAQGLLPLEIYYAWLNPLSDGAFQDSIRESAANLKSLAIAAGQDVADAAVYGNYAIFDTPSENIYGDNLPRLKEIKAQYDPSNVMGLAGGFKF